MSQRKPHATSNVSDGRNRKSPAEYVAPTLEKRQNLSDVVGVAVNSVSDGVDPA